MRITDLLRLPQGGVDLAAVDTAGTPGFDGGKTEGKEALPQMRSALGDLQEKLVAGGYTGSSRRILVVLQGMDTSGKGGVMSHAIGLLDPAGVRHKAFKRPTKQELSHHFLWRVKKELPEPGEIGIFDRSHYEDVLVTRVHQLVADSEIRQRYAEINRWEKHLADDGVTLLKCMLHISATEQKKRLLARLDDPTKQWKFKPGDLDERALWPAYQDAYTTALEATNTDQAPWYIVPSDRKWYRSWAIGRLLLEAMQALALEWPAPDYDLAAERRRLEQEEATA